MRYRMPDQSAWLYPVRCAPAKLEKASANRAAATMVPMVFLAVMVQTSVRMNLTL